MGKTNLETTMIAQSQLAAFYPLPLAEGQGEGPDPSEDIIRVPHPAFQADLSTRER